MIKIEHEFEREKQTIHTFKKETHIKSTDRDYHEHNTRIRSVHVHNDIEYNVQTVLQRIEQ